MSLATVIVDSGFTPTLSTTAVIPVLDGSVTGTGNATAGMTRLSSLATFFAANAGPVVTTSVTITSTAATALTAGRQGATNPVLQVDASTASVATGIALTGAAAAGGMAIAVISSGTDESLTINAKGAGTITLGGVSTGRVLLSRATTVTTTSATALAVGANGATNPVLVVDCNTGSVASGLSITGSTAAGTTQLATISSGASANLGINAKGSGTIVIGSVSTGNITVGVSGGTTQTIFDGTYGAGAASIRLNGLTTAAINNQAGTLTNAPSVGNPVFWLPVSIAGTVRYVPAWA